VIRPIDARHLGRERVICCWQVDDVLIDPGPSSTVDTILAAVGDERPRALLITHIHLDHAGSAGSLVRRWPDLEVWVSEIGAPHLIDPARLLASVARLAGDDMERLWGEMLPVPEQNLRVLRGGETRAGWRVAATPGHASHHVSFLHEASGWAFVGDTAGVRIAPHALLLPPTPPPDVDLEAWRDSLALIAAWKPAALAITHFGAVDEAGEHLERLRIALDRWGALARLADADAYAAALRATIWAALDPDAAAALEQAVPPDQQWAGLDRYWKHRAR